MRKKFLLLLAFFVYEFHTGLFASPQDDSDNYVNGIVRVGAISTLAGIGGYLGEKWAVDITTRIIRGNLQSGDPLFNLVIGGAVRGRTLIEAIPIAAKYGSYYGALGMTIFIPLVWDCRNSLVSSCKRISNTISGKKDDTATLWDYSATGVTSIGVILLAYAILK